MKISYYISLPFVSMYVLFHILPINYSILKAQEIDTILDKEGNSYRVVKIGEQWWMAENLMVTEYSNGDPIPHIKDATEWRDTREGAYCFYEDNAEYAKTYGHLYNWHTVNDERGICPEGWHVPSDREWMTMEKYLGMTSSEAGKMTAWRGVDEGDKLKHESFGGNNSSGFSALAAGYRDPEGNYKAMGTDNDYWTSTSFMNDGNMEGILHGLLNSKPTIVRNYHVPGYGFCVRCLKNNTTDVIELPEEKNIEVYPNPAGSHLFILNAADLDFIVTSIHGKKVMTDEIKDNNYHLDLSGLNSGAYFLTIVSNHYDFRKITFIKE